MAVLFTALYGKVALLLLLGLRFQWLRYCRYRQVQGLKGVADFLLLQTLATVLLLHMLVHRWLALLLVVVRDLYLHVAANYLLRHLVHARREILAVHARVG